MKLVGAAFGDGGHERAGVAPFIGPVGVGLNGELVERVWRGEDGRGVEVGIVIISAVELVVIGVAAGAVNREGGVLALIGGEAAAGARDELLELERIPAV